MGDVRHVEPSGDGSVPDVPDWAEDLAEPEPDVDLPRTGVKVGKVRLVKVRRARGADPR
jgi:hypothetical protein